MVRETTNILVAAFALCLESALVSGAIFPALAFAHESHGGSHGKGNGKFSKTHFGGLHFTEQRFGTAYRAGRGHGALKHGAIAADALDAMALAPNRLAAARKFHAIHGLEPHGFNRNAFGDMWKWNHWARDHWGAGWNYWGSGWGYWTGSVFSPFLYGDALSFALWPDALYDSFFAYGPDYLFASIFSPGPLYGAVDEASYPLFDVYGYPPDARKYYGYYRRQHHRRRAAAATDSASPAADCSGLAPGIASLPIDRIKRAIRATTQQTEILTQLETASTRAETILQGSCPSTPPLTPVGRLDAVATRLHAMIQAIGILRTPLTTLDESLDDKQRERLASLGGRSKYRHAGVAMSQAPARDLAALCKKQSAGFTLLPVQRIEDIVKPTPPQKAAFEALKSASTTAAANLDASCPGDVPETLAGRLDAVVNRLNALAEAVSIVKPPLTKFYATLSDEQKARFNVIGGINDTAAPPQDAAHSRI
ncbi:MAG: Spy/CpxP family protein refolding chaperone [Methylovirgula sp.]